MRYKIRIPIIVSHINLNIFIPISKRRLNRVHRRHKDGVYSVTTLYNVNEPVKYPIKLHFPNFAVVNG